MDPVTLALIGASLGGGILQATGQKKPQGINIEWLKKNFGADAVNEEMIRLFNNVINSPYGQQLLTGAAEAGQQFETDVARQGAAAGMGPGGGAESGTSIFSNAAAGQAGSNLQRGVRSGVMQQAMQQAQQIVNARMNAAVGGEMQRLAAENATPSTMQQIGGAIARGAGAGLAATPMQAAKPTAAAGMALPSTPEEGVWNAAANYRRPGFFSRLASRFTGRQPQLVTTGAR